MTGCEQMTGGRTRSALVQILGASERVAEGFPHALLFCVARDNDEEIGVFVAVVFRLEMEL
jgi:hypothetical protein